MPPSLIQKFDISIFYIINHKLQNGLFDFLMPFITEIGSAYFITALGLLFLIFRRRDLRGSGFLTLAGLTISETVSTILKEVFSRPRPVAIIESIHLLCYRNYTASFPSGHTTLVFTTATIIASLYPKLSSILFILASVVGFSRIYVGAHFPTDVIAGALLGIVIGKIITHIWRQGIKLSFKEG